MYVENVGTSYSILKFNKHDAVQNTVRQEDLIFLWTAYHSSDSDWCRHRNADS